MPAVRYGKSLSEELCNQKMVDSTSETVKKIEIHMDMGRQQVDMVGLSGYIVSKLQAPITHDPKVIFEIYDVAFSAKPNFDFQMLIGP